MSSILSKPLSFTSPCSASPASKFFCPIRGHGFRNLTYVTLNRRKSMVVKSNTPPVPSASPSSGSGPGKGWLVLIALTFIIPFLRMGKFGPLLLYKNKMDAALQKVEDAVELLEEAAERVDEEAEKLSGKIPQGKLKDALNAVEHAAEKVARDAHRLDEAIDKVQDLEEKLENEVKRRSK